MTLGLAMAKKFLTNEKLRGIFKNNFELTNAAIDYARSHIQDEPSKNLDDLLADITRHVQEEKRNSEQE